MKFKNRHRSSTVARSQNRGLHLGGGMSRRRLLKGGMVSILNGDGAQLNISKSSRR